MLGNAVALSCMTRSPSPLIVFPQPPCCRSHASSALLWGWWLVNGVLEHFLYCLVSSGFCILAPSRKLRSNIKWVSLQLRYFNLLLFLYITWSGHKRDKSATNCVISIYYKQLYTEYHVLQTVKLLSPGHVHIVQLSKTSRNFKIKYNYYGFQLRVWVPQGMLPRWLI